MNILLTCVGRRSYLVNYFKSELKKEGGKVIGANSILETTGMHACDVSYRVPSITDKSYIERLLEIAKKENVKMIISLFDIDLGYLSEAKARFEALGVTVIVSSKEVIEIANDKYKTFQFLKENNILTPKTYNSYKSALEALDAGELSYPLFLKPRWGMASIGIHKIYNFEELQFFYKKVKDEVSSSYVEDLSSDNANETVLFQEFIGGTEYGVDIFNDLNGEFLLSVEKEKIEMRSGETDGAVVVKNKHLSALSIEISQKLKHIANLDMDVLYDGEKYYVLELNARFGGGFPFSYLAGANFPKLLIDMVNGDKLTIPSIEIGTKSLKSIVPIKIN